MKLLSNFVHCAPDIMGGIPVFAGTRVPIKTLLDYLEAGDSLNIFLDHFPSVSREQAIAVCFFAEIKDEQMWEARFKETSDEH
jgi:uncharacterized protein (DUF433 family)